MGFYHYFPSVTFVVQTADQFVGRDDGLLEQQKKDSHVCRRNHTFPLILRKKNQSPYFKDDNKSKKLRIKGMEFLTCDGCEHEYNK